MIELERYGDVHVLHMRGGENRFNPDFLAAMNDALDRVEASAARALGRGGEIGHELLQILVCGLANRGAPAAGRPRCRSSALGGLSITTNGCARVPFDSQLTVVAFDFSDN